MNTRTAYQIYNIINTSVAYNCDRKDREKNLIRILSNNIDSLISTKDRLIELYDLYYLHYNSLAISYLLIHEFKNIELNNVLMTHRGKEYIQYFIINQEILMTELRKYGLSDNFFSSYFDECFSKTQIINEDFIINYMINAPEENKKPDRMLELFSCYIRYVTDTDNTHDQFSKISKNTMLNAAKKLFDHSKQTTMLAKHFSTLDYINFTDGGGSNDNYKEWTKLLISHLPTSKNLNSELVNNLEHYAENGIPLMGNYNFGDEWIFLRTQGRTILLQNKQGDILGIKVKKEAEPVNELAKEFQTTNYLKLHAEQLKLKSYFHTPMALIKIDNIINLIQNFGAPIDLDTTILTSLTGTTTDQIAYIYKVDADQTDYFTYLHDIKFNNDIFKESNQIIINDLFQLLSNGVVYHQLANLFHNGENGHEMRDDRGRYLILVNLLRKIGHKGTGRLDEWQKGIKHPNLRKGIADDGDWISFCEFAYGKFAETYFSDTKNMHGEKSSNYILANIMAEYLYVLFLIAGKRGYDLTQQAYQSRKSSEEINETIQIIWSTLAKQQLENCSQALSIFSPLSNEQAKDFMLEITNIEHLANQMRFWMTEEYIPHFKMNLIPEGIYDDSVRLELNFEHVRKGTFNDKVGFSINGKDQDLGTVNGQEPIKEFNKMLYWMVSGIVSSYHIFNKANQEMDNMSMQFDLIDKITFELNQPSMSSEKIRLAILKLNRLQKECDQLKWTFSLPMEQLKALIIYREKIHINSNISSNSEQQLIDELRKQHGIRTIQSLWQKKVNQIKEHKSKNQIPLPPPFPTANPYLRKENPMAEKALISSPPSFPPFNPNWRKK